MRAVTSERYVTFLVCTYIQYSTQDESNPAVTTVVRRTYPRLAAYTARPDTGYSIIPLVTASRICLSPNPPHKLDLRTLHSTRRRRAVMHCVDRCTCSILQYCLGYTVKINRISADILWPVFHISTEPPRFRIRLCPYIGSVKIWKTRHNISGDTDIFYSVSRHLSSTSSNGISAKSFIRLRSNAVGSIRSEICCTTVHTTNPQHIEAM